MDCAVSKLDCLCVCLSFVSSDEIPGGLWLARHSSREGWFWEAQKSCSPSRTTGKLFILCCSMMFSSPPTNRKTAFCVCIFGQRFPFGASVVKLFLTCRVTDRCYGMTNADLLFSLQQVQIFSIFPTEQGSHTMPSPLDFFERCKDQRDRAGQGCNPCRLFFYFF